MTQAADITVKKDDGSTDITYFLLQSSAGDGTKARWFANPMSTVRRDLRPYMEVKAASNGDSTSRRVDIVFAWPILKPIIGSSPADYTVAGWNRGSYSLVIPNTTSDSDCSETVSQFAHLLNSNLITSALKTTYAPN